MDKVTKKIPNLRFPEFSGDWKKTILNDHISDWKGGASIKSDEFVKHSEFKVIPKKAVTSGSKLLLNNDSPTFVGEDTFHSYQQSVVNSEFLITTLRDLVPSGPNIGYIVENDYSEPLLMAQGVYSFKLDSIEPEFLTSYSNRVKYRHKMGRILVGSTQVHIRGSDFRNQKLFIPTSEEQKKIGHFLSTVDQKIQQFRRKKELLEQYKKGVMQKLFSQETRFKDENGEGFPNWEYQELGDISDRITDKNEDQKYDFVLTNSAVEGVVSQTDYFDKSIANKSNLGGYYIVKKDDFVYNPRISSEAPVGPIKRNKLKTGVMSPLYSVFRVQEENLDFFEYFFETTLWHRYMHSVANFGARHDRMNITVGDFQKLPIPVPSEEEREKITDFINSVSKRVKTVTQKLELAENFKKGLLQQMFV